MRSILTVLGLAAVTTVISMKTPTSSILNPITSDVIGQIILDSTTDENTRSGISPLPTNVIASTTTLRIDTSPQPILSSDQATISDQNTSTRESVKHCYAEPTKDSGKEHYDLFDIYNLALGQPDPDNYNHVYFNQDGSSIPEIFLASYELANYSSLACAERCDRTRGCVAFNIFFERTPRMNLEEGCPDVPSSSTIKCSLSRSPLSGNDITYQGYSLYDIWVTIAGSNAYNKKDIGAKVSEDENRPPESIAPIVVISASVIVVFVALTSSVAWKWFY